MLTSARDHATASGIVARTVESISGEFRSLAERVRGQLSELEHLVDLPERVLRNTDGDRRHMEQLSGRLRDLGSYAAQLEEKIDDGETRRKP